VTMSPPSSTSARRRQALRLLAACALGFAAALLVSCGSSGKGLIPSANAGPLQADFEAVNQAAQSGDCATTQSAIAKTEQDYNTLPASINAGLRTRLREGITHLSKRALEVCAQPLATPTSTGTTAKTTSTATTPTTATTTTPTTTTPTTTPTTTTPTNATPGPGGGTVAPGEKEAPAGGGTGAGEGGQGGVGAGGVGAGGQEGGK
jgi:hypothetical protein